MTSAYSYTRFSTPEQMLGDSYRRQTELAQQYAQRHGLELDTQLTLNDLGVSAYRGKNARSGALGAFLQAIDAGLVPEGSILLVESLDRVTRQDPWDALPIFQQIINAGVSIVTLQDEKEYSREALRANPMRILESLFVMIRANEESATKSRRLKAAWSAKRQRAKEQVLTAIAPYWLDLDPTTRKFKVIEERAAVVRRIFEMAAQGQGQHRIAQTLNREGVPVFGRGLRWHRSYIAKLLSGSAVIGTFVPHELHWEGSRKQRRPGEAVPGYFPAIVEPGLFENVQAMTRDARAPLRGRHAASGTVSNLFGGLSKCPVCGGTMTRVSKGPKGGKAYLVCAKAKEGGGCQYRGISYERVEEAFIEDVFRVIATAPAGDDGADVDAEIEQVDANMSAIDDAMRNIMEGIERGRATTIERQRLRELENEHEGLERRHNELLEKRAELAGPLVDQRLDALHAVFKAPTLDRRQANAILRQLFSAVEVNYRRGDLILDWKHGGLSYVVFGFPEGDGDVNDDAALVVK